ncbi:hypothetical protein [Labedaea rhizosphaerae]|uniref:Uncharacterized protein n=1 Tax=Labedaea rhizosphaerae TaxID=598644 RepID=A0A4R6SP62_LABRH|nr:hypothetical protein [Labedaea rhizosphaerae]TDQ05784.1 hypothetical protein EV186_1011762 [Labedaea rhizosphaerae]
MAGGTLTTDASQLLDDQIRAGAPADVVDNDTGANIMEGPLRKFWDLMQQWGPIYDKWRKSSWAGGDWPDSSVRGAPGGARPEPYNPTAWDSVPYPNEQCVENRLPQIGTINFGLIYDMAQRFKSMTNVGGNLSQAMRDAKNSVSQVWEGKAADAALDRFTDIDTAASMYADSNAKLDAAVRGLWANAREAVKEIARYGDPDQFGGWFVAEYGKEDVGGWQKRLQNFDMVTERSGARTLPELIDYAKTHGRDFAGDVYFPEFTDDGMNYLSEAVVSKVALDNFTQAYHSAAKAFRATIGTSFDLILKAFGELQPVIDGMRMGTAGEAAPANPFAKLAPPPQDTQTPQTRTPTGATTTSTTTPANAGAGGGYTGGGSSYVPPYRPPTEAPVVGSATAPAAAVTMPDLSTSSSLPGLSSALTAPAAAEPETVTITDGDRKISVQSPDGQGHVKVSIDDGTGKAKTYDMDFGGAAGGRLTTPTSGQTGANPDDEAAASDDVEHVPADDSGKAVIHDGATTITGEHPGGAPDQLKLTVDDGTGHPSTYNVDYGGQTGAGDVQLTSPQAEYGPPSGPPMDHGHGHDPHDQSDLAYAGSTTPAAPGDATLAAAPDQGNAGQQAGAMGGMPMMGGMGGGGGGGGGDSQRGGGSGWRTTGNLFEDEFDHEAWLREGGWGDGATVNADQPGGQG